MSAIFCNVVETHMKYAYDDQCYSINELSARWKRGFALAINAASKSDATVSRDKMGAVIMCGSRVLSAGCNQYSKTRPGNLFKREGRLLCVSTHAEQTAIDGIKYRNYENNKLVCYVARVNTLGELVASKPCILCINSLKKAGVSIVRFINMNGDPEEIYL